jgi:acyl-CoA dehydrogenase
MDQHDYHGELIGAMCKIQCTELMFEAVYKCMQVVGVNSLDKQHNWEKLLREAAVLPLYDAGNFGMQRRRVHGVLASPDFDPRALMDNRFVRFTKAMEIIDTVPGYEEMHLPAGNGHRSPVPAG